MQSTDRFKFKLPQGMDFFDIEHENVNWQLVESVLREASIGEIATVEKLDNGSTKITYTDDTYTVYSKLNPETSTITKTDYNAEGIQMAQETEYAGKTTMGIVAMVNNTQEDVDRKYYELLSYIVGFGVRQMVPFSITLSNFYTEDQYDKRNDVVVTLNYTDGTSSKYTIGTNGSVYQQDFGTDGVAVNQPSQISLTDTFYHTHVKIAQLEKKLELLTHFIDSNYFYTNCRDMTILNGTVGAGLAGADTQNLCVNTSLTATVNNAYVDVDLDNTYYAVTVKCAANMDISRAFAQVAFIDVDTNTVLATGTMNGTAFVTSNTYSIFSFIMNATRTSSGKVRIMISVLPMGTITPVIYFDHVYVTRATTAIGSGPVR